MDRISALRNVEEALAAFEDGDCSLAELEDDVRGVLRTYAADFEGELRAYRADGSGAADGLVVLAASPPEARDRVAALVEEPGEFRVEPVDGGKLFWCRAARAHSMSTLPEVTGDVTAALVCTSSMGPEDGCTELLSRATPETTVLWVTYTRSPADCIEHYRAAGEPGSLTVITVGDAPANAPADAGDVAVKSVSTPDDLTGLGVTLSQALSTHPDAIVCFDSLTVLLQYVDHETAYEFLNAVTGQLYAADARAHFHLDPNAHDTQTIDALASLFDVVTERQDGEWSARRRKLLQ